MKFWLKIKSIFFGTCEKCGGKMITASKGNYTYFAEVPDYKVCQKCWFTKES